MSLASIPFKLTVAGQNAAFNLGILDLEITHVQLGSGNKSPSGTEVALLEPQEYSAITSHFEISAGQHRIAAVVAGSGISYEVSEIGLWAGVPGGGSSALVFYWSIITGFIAVKSVSVDFNFENDLFFGGVVPANITIVADTSFNALAMLAAHEVDPDAHEAITTAPQFDNDSTPANTAFVQRALGNFRFYSNISSNTVLNLANIGSIYTISGSPAITLPSAASCPQGSAIHFKSLDLASAPVISRAGLDIINFGTGFTSETSITLNPGESITFVSNGGNIWHVMFGSALMRVMSFKRDLISNGYQFFPGGLVFQFGTATVTEAGTSVPLNITFPNAILHVWAVDTVQNSTTISNATTNGMCGISDKSTSAIKIHANGLVSWFAIGF